LKEASALTAAGAHSLPLYGIPVAIKDNIDVAGMPTTAGCPAYSYVPERTATVVQRLLDAGAILIGKTNLHEFALGTTSEDSAFGPVRNPRDFARSAGGSSGGSGVAVVSGMGLASIGTDTGGSIRIPAAACGAVGLKGSLGEVPTDGVIPLSASFDHVGPLAQTVADAALVWSVVASKPMPDLAAPRAIRLRRLVGYFDRPIEPAVRERFERALEQLQASGIALENRELGLAPGIVDAYVNTVLPEGAAWHAQYLDSRPNDYTPAVRARFEAGRTIPAVKYLEAAAFCRRLRAEVDALLADADALVLPTLPLTAPLLGAGDITIDPALGGTMPVRSAMLKHTQPFNMSGHPAISLPLPVTGLPVGLQLVGRRDNTAGLLAIAAACEKIVSNG
jgi:aspartyl-tRNA(Asn)/glutamyl-tRNA(Gln) amidotransferase subunit A